MLLFTARFLLLRLRLGTWALMPISQTSRRQWKARLKRMAPGFVAEG